MYYYAKWKGTKFVVCQQQEDYLVFYLCAVFAPICPAGFHLDAARGSTWRVRRHHHNLRRTRRLLALDETAMIPPCRAVCETARAGCEPVMKRYGVIHK